ncbi:MAG: efflux RND transporter periplasmic adaptor subunit [Gammaproteobacteria bacterium]|nr:efflux RND transporter periplasmic adaptor subunit [Gammaproteobacteria bacterium]
MSLLGACGAPPPPAPPAPEVTVAKPLVREVGEWDEFTARLAAVETVELRARVGGYVESVTFAEGALVREGDLLLVIDPQPYEAALARARAEADAATARLELARSEEARAVELARAALISAQERDSRQQRRAEAEAELAAAKAAVREATLDLGYCQVRAPISGRIGRRLVTRGNLVSSGEREATLLATIVAVDPIHAYITADEQAYLRYLRMAREGTRPSPREVRTPARLRLADEEGWPHEGWVDFVDNQLDRATGTIQGRAVFSNRDGVLAPGLFAQLRVRGARPYTAILVPETALGTDQERRVVWVLGDGDVPVTRDVTPGRQVGMLRVIAAGLTADDRVLINGTARIRPGMRVKPVEGSIEEPADLAAVETID